MHRRGHAVLSAVLSGTCLISVLAVSAHVSDAEPLTRIRALAPTEGAGAGNASGMADSDGDGLSDACETWLAERFAPIVYHSSDESNYPTNVDDFLALTSLGFHDDGCSEGDSRAPVSHLGQSALLMPRATSCRAGETVRSDGTRSVGKHQTFFLADVSDAERGGSPDTRDWTTYFHAYPNDLGGVTVQYWRFYAFNDAANDHGGDWEGLHVVLDDALMPRTIRLLTHDRLTQPPLARFRFEGTHVRVFSEGGGHATRFSGGAIAARGCAGSGRCVIDPSDPETFVRQETWSGGEVRGPKNLTSTSGRLVNLGSKLRPMNGQAFVQYSGLWGSPGVFYGTSGFWGPAFNETSMRADGFVSAWCEGMTATTATTALTAMLADECYPRETTR
jgi:hypothetical protein